MGKNDRIECKHCNRLTSRSKMGAHMQRCVASLFGDGRVRKRPRVNCPLCGLEVSRLVYGNNGKKKKNDNNNENNDDDDDNDEKNETKNNKYDKDKEKRRRTSTITAMKFP
ncbi:hypothetical protein FOZ63_028426 [Perkinsus olseni]|uniref:Uncharacterized protein n=1 Tax=Perkinsus olseni TaxID=32597 RepID=A0A7J6RRY2_PEROL|nr:hypothetical protein FOZ62_027006 [Perkinsus olseni]KAF4737177.1 hypothetical protein FOZ63_028426 [Perkinsus olseni]